MSRLGPAGTAKADGAIEAIRAAEAKKKSGRYIVATQKRMTSIENEGLSLQMIEHKAMKADFIA